MNRQDRFRAAVAGEPLDWVPRTCWAHYMTETLGGAEHARRHIVYQDEYDWDILKVVNDFHYPFPENVETIRGPADMERFRRADMSEYLFAEELDCLRILRAHYGPDLPIVFTTFDPWRQIVRRAGMASIPVLKAHREETLRMLRAVGDSMCTFMGALRDAGCDGIFFSVNSGNQPGSPLYADDETYATFMRDFEIEMLEAMEGMVRFIHVHGAPVSLERFTDYPVDVFSVSDWLKGNPTLAELRDATGKAVIGGIDESRIADMTPDELRAQIADTLASHDRGLILSPGCTIPIWTPAHLLRILADTGA
ncbi:uroporphyrinogen decarboxylase family protein [Ruegeria marina]|uniref:Uroporphyrinogen decarboxylase (URO-D) n=1 Tax=Ruegeria marina TaxID=639004 RepID=A0A1G7FSB2_9RHOB|nr:uroporphyrinogen decarboxylase family protein [Ruegeria marina]SDE78672.1 Uroporphyrinogen decarboxylase (URO-D) [Ruegeria marina]